jgi:hypothetical protein
MKIRRPLFFILLLLGTGLSAQHCFTLYEDELKNYTAFNTITILEETPSGDILFGGKSSLGGGLGLAYFNGTTVTNYKSANSDLPDNIVQCAAFFGDSTWVGTNAGLAGFDDPSKPGWKIYSTGNGLPSNNVTAITILEDGTKWVGFGNGTAASINNGVITTYNIAGTAVNDFTVGSDGRLYAAVNFSVSATDQIYFLEGGIWRAIENDLLRNVKSLATSDNGLLIGNTSNLLFMFDPVTMEMVSSLTAGSVDKDLVFFKSLIAPGGSMWVSTNKGLLQYNNGTYRNFTGRVSAIPELIMPPLQLSRSGALWFSYAFTDSFDYGGLGLLTITDNGFNATPSGSVAFCEGSSLGIDAGEGYEYYYWNEQPGSQFLATDTAGTYTIAVDEGGNCYSYDTVTAERIQPYEEQEICVVTVDEGKVIVAWQRTYNENIWYTNIYRESSQTDVYDKLDSIFIDDIQAYIDPTADPRVKSYKYRISVVDSCGNESEMSAPHKTLHLRANVAINGGVNLAWTHYEGQSIKSYEIRRGPTQGTATDLITTVASSENSYFYDAPTTDVGDYYYVVEAVLPYVCDPTAKKGRSGPFTRSVSNLKSVSSGEPSLDLSDTTLVAGASTGRFVGKFDLRFNDEPLDQYITFVDVEGEPSDNDMFMIENDSLFTNAVFPHDPSIVYTIWVGTGYTVDDPVVIADWSFDLAVNRLVGTEKLEAIDNILVFPNPAGKLLNIRMPEKLLEFATLQIMDVSGRTVLIQDIIGENMIQVQTDKFSPGMYTIQLKGNQKETYRSRFIVE